jgi:uncharacterized protein YndB with AHSA1/START domain
MPSETDRIHKEVLLDAPLDRVFRAVSDSREFGAWFGVEFDGAFEPGRRMTGRIVPTKVDPVVAKSQEPYAGAKFEIVVDRIETGQLFSFRWHPFAVEPNHDYSAESMTLVEFRFEAVGGKTRLTITETGFDAIPAARRAKAFEMNSGGWTAQIGLVTKYVAHVR